MPPTRNASTWCLRGPAESVTAGWLSEMTGLTTGAITHILDRLEKRGFVERLRDPERSPQSLHPRPARGD